MTLARVEFKKKKDEQIITIRANNATTKISRYTTEKKEASTSQKKSNEKSAL